MVSIGIDIGLVTAKAAAFNGKEIVATSIYPTGWSPKEVGNKLLKDIKKELNIDNSQIKSIIGTGYGRVSLPFIDRVITEIPCHGRGPFI